MKPAPTNVPAPSVRRTRFALGLVAWLWVAGLVCALMLAQELGLRTRALLFFLGLVLLIRILGWIGDLLRSR